MADFARYLPLSNRPRHDESGVTSDRRDETATVLAALAALLRATDDDTWARATARPGWSVGDVAAELVAGFDRSAAQRALDAAGRIVRGSEARRLAELPRLEGPARAAQLLDARALALRERERRTGIAELDDAVVTAVLIGDAAGRPVPVPPVASGAVALRRAAAAPVEIRAVISGHSLHATDAGWTIGRGSPLVGTAAELVRFLAGYGTTAPRPGSIHDGDADAGGASGGRAASD
ncbi:hypothetical protein EDM22_18780 [Agromyces tardus]|uniref:Uncharacterized protein n=1 Tax=Agromyces tardus TaxID=2583849 RepID=A0A3M7ZY55_9MICO|nr:hypothetical protein [Agromyces tardus]RNB43367.1 hypothetical protein EDM22_18780 [Agromyces tardus]